MFTDAQNSSYVLYLHQAPAVRVAIVFHAAGDRLSMPEVAKAMDLCMQTLAVGPEAATLRERYKPAN
jgi:hypothetical protein